MKIKTVGSICSGIEAASVAWNELKFKFSWFSEIADFPSKVLKEKYPKIENLGDMNDIPELIKKFNGLTDLRNQSYVKYQMKVIFIVRLMGLMCEMKSMQGMTRELNTEEAIRNIAQICGLELEEIPHCDTINDVFEKVKVEEIEKIRKYMITKLIRGKIIQTRMGMNIKNIAHMY